MEESWISLRATTVGIITILQIQAVISNKTRAVLGLEGQSVDFACEYPEELRSKDKFFCRIDLCSNNLMQTEKHNTWVKHGRFSLFDNTTGGFFIVRVEALVPEDRGMYLCGVDVSRHSNPTCIIQLNVSTVTSPPTPLNNIIVDKHTLPLFLIMVTCMTALLFVCLFTICLLLAMKRRRSGTRQNREVSSDYETMKPGVWIEPECQCGSSARKCLAPPGVSQPGLCPHLTAQYRESVVSFGLSEYIDVDASRCSCHYQHLDVNGIEEHIYHPLHASSSPKGAPPGIRDQIN